MKVAGDTRLKMVTFFGLEKFVLDNFKEEEILALKEPILVRDKFLILPTSSWISLSFRSFRAVVDYMEGNQNCRAYYHGSLSTSVLEERPSKLSQQQRYKGSFHW